MIRTKTLFISILVMLLAGCFSVDTPLYRPDSANKENLSTLPKVAIGNFEIAKPYTDKCRGTVTLIPRSPSNTFEGYIRDAIISELRAADRFDYGPTPKIVINGMVTRLEAATHVGFPPKGRWEIDLTLTSSNGKAFSLVHSFQHDSATDGTIACPQSARGFAVAVKTLINRIFESDDFKSLLTL